MTFTKTIGFLGSIFIAVALVSQPTRAALSEQRWDLSSGTVPPKPSFSFWDPGKNAFSIAVSDDKTPDGDKSFVVTYERESSSTDEWKCQLLFFPELPIVKGHTYRIRFWAKASASGLFESMAGLATAPYTQLGSKAREPFKLSTKWTFCAYEFTADQDVTGRVTLPRLMVKGFPVGTKINVGSLAVRDLSAADTLDLRPVANFGFADAKEADGVGGWSDQGPENDFSRFPIKQTSFVGMPFRIVDPAQNGGKAILAFEWPQVKTGLKRAVLDIPALAAGRKYLYLLQTLCSYNGKEVEPVGKVIVTMQDGSTQELPVQSGRDMADWWAPRKLPNGLVGYSFRNGSAEVGVYLSRYEMPGKPVSKITLETAGTRCWIVVGATLSDFTADAVTVPEEVIEANDQWKAADLSDLIIKPGSALDFSALVDRSPAGTYGRLIVNPQGRPAFEKTPDKPVRFFTCPVLPSHALSQKSAFTHEQIDQYADAIKRQGYNMVRLHFLDSYLMGTGIIAKKENPTYFDDPATIPFEPGNFDRVLYFVGALKKRGIYILLDLGTETTSYTDAYPWKNNLQPWELQVRLFVEPKVRALWRAGATKLLTTVNPYTGLPLAKDPVIAATVFYNEQNTRFTYGNKANQLGETFHPAWKKWVQERYKTTEALQKAWAGSENLPSPLTFDTIPLIDETRYNSGGPVGRDMAKFIVELSRDLTQWYESTVHAAGYDGLTVQWDFVLRQSEIPLRAMMPIVVMHGYQAHPSDWIRPGSVIDQNSGLTSGGGYFRFLAPTRLLDRPFLISEYGHVFWNQYRHEQGLFFSSYARLQDWDCVALSHIPVYPWAEPMVPFNNTGVDPVNRASEVVSAMIFLRGDVSPSTHTVEFPLTEKEVFDTGNTYSRAFNYDLSMLYALCKVGITYTGSLTPIRPGAPVKSDLKIQAGEGAAFRDHGAFGTVESSGKSETALVRAVRQIRDAGIIDSANATDVSKRFYQSDTKELSIGVDGDGFLSVITPRLEGVVMKHDARQTLKTLTVNSCSVPASVTAASLDPTKTLDASDRLLVVFSTDALNTGMKFTTPERKIVLDRGKLPVLIETGKISVTIANKALSKPVAYALKFNGERGDKLPVTVADGKLTVEVDTAKLAIGPTPFIEIAQEGK